MISDSAWDDLPLRSVILIASAERATERELRRDLEDVPALWLITAKQPDAALKLLRQVHIDLLMIDVQPSHHAAPDARMLDLGQRARNETAFTGRIIFLTASAAPENRPRGRRLGDAILERPIDREHLRATVLRSLRRDQRRRRKAG